MTHHSGQHRPISELASREEQAAMTQTAIVAVLRDEVEPLSTREIKQRLQANAIGAAVCNRIHAVLMELYNQGVLGRAKVGHDVSWELSEQYWDRVDLAEVPTAARGVAQQMAANSPAHQPKTTPASVAALFRRC